jgi:inosine-uridine nucleoside N-ribohydrolase
MDKKWKLLFCIVLVFTILAGCVPADEEPLLTSAPQPAEEIFPEPLGGKIPLIFSHGGGPCDIAALVYFSKHPNVDLIGMVLSRGEIHPENALDDWPIFLFDVLKYKGTAIALGTNDRMDPNSHEFPAEWRSGADNFWGLALPEQVTEFDTAVGPELIIELVNNSPEKVTLIAMASMIDIALALQQDPGIIDNIANIVIMGGAFTMRGNLDEGPEWTSNEVAEWNMYIDALAAKYVFNSGVPLSIVPLDGIQYLVQSKDIDVINTINDPGVNYVAQMWNQQYGWSGGAGFLIWDTITATAVTNPENFDWTYDGVDVIADPGDFQGQTIALNNGAQHTRYATGANYDAILDQLFEIFWGETALGPPATAVSSDLIITELAGTWEGFTGDFHITFVLEPECTLNEKCGTFEIPEFSLSGDVAIVAVNGNMYEFKTTNLSSGQPSNNYEYLLIQDDGTLFYSTTDSGATSEAVLYRK